MSVSTITTVMERIIDAPAESPIAVFVKRVSSDRADVPLLGLDAIFANTIVGARRCEIDPLYVGTFHGEQDDFDRRLVATEIQSALKAARLYAMAGHVRSAQTVDIKG